MRPGIFAKTFPRTSLQASLDAVVASTVRSVQFNLGLTGGPSLPDVISNDLSGQVRRAMGERSLVMAAVSGTYNMAHPDPIARQRGLKALRTLIAAAPALGTRVVTVCTGTRAPDDMWRWHPDNGSAAAWEDMTSAIQAAVAEATVHDVTIAFEPEPSNVVADARAGRRLLDEIASPHLKVVMDAANLVLGGALEQQARTLERAFDLLGDDLVLAHAKDVLADGTVVPAGRGLVDYRLYVSQLREARYDGALILHGLGEDAVPASVAFLREQLQASVARLPA